jgi:hypothetical protein
MPKATPPWRTCVRGRCRNVIYDARSKARRTPICVGLRDAVIVQTDDATLVAHKSQAQKVKELVARLAEDPTWRRLV